MVHPIFSALWVTRFSPFWFPQQREEGGRSVERLRAESERVELTTLLGRYEQERVQQEAAIEELQTT